MREGPIGPFKVIRFCKNGEEGNDEREMADAGSLRDAGGGGGTGGDQHLVSKSRSSRAGGVL